MPLSEAAQANQILADEASNRFPSFSASDAVTLGLSIRKRFRASSRHTKGNKGLVISIQTIAGHLLFGCTVGDLGHQSGYADVSLDSWEVIDHMIEIVKRTGHASFYVEKGMGALGMSAKQLGLKADVQVNGGAYPIWLENALCCPIAIAACYSGSSQDDHQLVASTVKDYLAKMRRDSGLPPMIRTPPPMNSMPIPAVPILSPTPQEEPGRVHEWLQEQPDPTYPESSTPLLNIGEYKTFDEPESIRRGVDG